VRETEGTLLYSHLLRPFLFRCDPEFAHDLTLQTLHYLGPALALVEPFVNLADPLLETECLGLRFRNPIGLAAGLDKNGKALHALKHSVLASRKLGPSPRAHNPAIPDLACSDCAPIKPLSTAWDSTTKDRGVSNVGSKTYNDGLPFQSE